MLCDVYWCQLFSWMVCTTYMMIPCDDKLAWYWKCSSTCLEAPISQAETCRKSLTALFKLHRNGIRTGNREWNWHQWVLVYCTELFTLARDRERDQDPSFPTVLVHFPALSWFSSCVVWISYKCNKKMLKGWKILMLSSFYDTFCCLECRPRQVLLDLFPSFFYWSFLLL